MEQHPYPEDYAKASEYLRLALSFLSGHKIPPSPLNCQMESMRQELEQVKEESKTDSLTGLSNRKAFDAALEHTVHSAREQQSTFCVLLADIDHFKQFNERWQQDLLYPQFNGGSSND